MNKRYIIPFVLVIVLMSVAMASADGWGCSPYCYTGPNCCYPYYPYPVQPVVRECASFVSDVTIPDGSFVNPGSTFIKTWRIRNNGTTVWNTNYKLVFVSGTRMAAQSYVNLPYTVAPGQTVDISVTMTAPTEADTYKSNWMLQSDTGAQFGVGSNCQTAVYAEIKNFVVQYNWNNYYVPQPPCPPRPQPPCPPPHWRVPNFELDGDLNPRYPRPW